MSPIYVPGKLTLRKEYIGTDDPDAQAYIAAVEAADEAASPGVGALELGVKVAIHSFVKGCKNDGIWPAIKASCILAGARTLDGALVSLVGTAPTNYNFVAGDYNRETGLVGNGSTKYLDSNRNNNADPQDDQHVSVFASSINTNTRYYIGASAAASGATNVFSVSEINLGARNRNSTPDNNFISNSIGLIGASRNAASVYELRGSGSSVNINRSSQIASSDAIHVFGSSTTTSARADARLAFYSIGKSLDLALLDARVTNLVNAIGAAIP